MFTPVSRPNVVAVDVHVAEEEARRVRQVEGFTLELEGVSIQEPEALRKSQVDAELRRPVERQDRQVTDLVGSRIEEHLPGKARSVAEIIGAYAAARWSCR